MRWCVCLCAFFLWVRAKIQLLNLDSWDFTNSWNTSGIDVNWCHLVVSRRTASAQWLVLCEAQLVSVAALETLTVWSILTCQTLMGGCLWYEWNLWVHLICGGWCPGLNCTCVIMHTSSGMLNWGDGLHVRWSVDIKVVMCRNPQKSDAC